MSTPPPIEVRRHGTAGPEVVVLHGGPGAPGSAAGLARALALHARVLEPWQRRSGAAPLTVAQHVADLREVAPAGAVLVGHSWGAMLAMSYAVAHGDQVASIVLVGCGTYDEETRALYRRRIDERRGPEGRARLDDLRRRLAACRDPALADALLAEIGDLADRAMATDPVPDPASQEGPPPDARGHDETWNDVLRRQAEGLEPAAFAAIRVPVLMLHGDDDPHPGPETRDLLRRFIPHLEYRGFPRCGHVPWAERHARDAFLAALSAWITRPAR